MIGAARQRLKTSVKTRLGPAVANRQPRRTDLPLAQWGLTINGSGALSLGAVDLLDLARRLGTPLHVADGGALDRNVDSARLAGGGADIFYSYKTNPVPGVLRRLHGRGIGAEVISPFELWLAFHLGVPPARIIYNGPAKSVDSMRDAIRREVFMINANSAGEAALIGRLAAEERRTVNLGIRVALPDMWGGQFGIGAASPQLGDAVGRAMGDPHIELRGLHFHRGLTIRDTATMERYVRSILEFCDELRDVTRWHPAVLDFGGSLACPTVSGIPPRQYRLNRALGCDLLPPDPADCLSVAGASTIASAAVDEHFAARGLPPPKAILEPGRSLTGNTQLLLTTVVDVKDDGELVHAVLDAGINIAEPVRSEYHQLFSVSTPALPATTAYRLVGPICTPADVLYHNWRLPPLEPGHVLAVTDSGAYFVPFSTTFSFPKPAIVLLDGSDVVPLRRREEYEDIVALDDVSGNDAPPPARRSRP